MSQLSLVQEEPEEPITSSDRALLFHWIDNGVSPSENQPETLLSIFGSHRPFDGPPDEHRRYWRPSRIEENLGALEEEGSIERDVSINQVGFWTTREGRARYGRVNLRRLVSDRPHLA